ncbi:MAG: hypothetical protein AABX71_03520 [Nanoarchaeota archaeon]
MSRRTERPDTEYQERNSVRQLIQDYGTLKVILDYILPSARRIVVATAKRGWDIIFMTILPAEVEENKSIFDRSRSW